MNKFNKVYGSVCYKAFVLQCNAFKALYSTIKSTLAEITSFTWKFKLCHWLAIYFDILSKAKVSSEDLHIF